MASNVRRERQELLIQELTRDNGMLERKVAGYQLALQVRTSRVRLCGSLNELPRVLSRPSCLQRSM